MSLTIRLDPEDNVVTATRTLESGTAVETIAARGIIPRNHKLATRDIAAGEAVRKYAQVIGQRRNPAGVMSTQGVEFRNISSDYDFATDLRPVAPTPMARATVSWAIGARAPPARATISASQPRELFGDGGADDRLAFGPEEMAHIRIDGVVASSTAPGRPDRARARGAAAGDVGLRNPNHGVLMVGLGCEMNQIDWLSRPMEVGAFSRP